MGVNIKAAQVKLSLLNYLKTDDAFRDDAQTAQCGRVVCQILSIDGEILVERSHGEGVHNLQSQKHSSSHSIHPQHVANLFFMFSPF